MFNVHAHVMSCCQVIQHSAVRRLRQHLFPRYRQRTQCHRALHVSYACADRKVTHDAEKRIAFLTERIGLDNCWPRLPSGFSQTAARSLLSSAIPLLEPGETLEPAIDDEESTWKDPVSIAGRVKSVRNVSSKLAFLDIILEPSFKHPDEHTVDWLERLQAVCKFGQLETSGVSIESFKNFIKLARPGDSLLFTGWPHRTDSGESSILITELPQLLSPALHQTPKALDDPETRARKKHVDMLVNSEAIETFKIRSEIEHIFHDFFRARGFVKTTTPILAAGAGGATARSFETAATEFQDQTLHLRIAPELWLKRLIVGGLNKVYEIGPTFRNEGVDATHNPEFSICEFYEAYAGLDDLIDSTCALLTDLVEKLQPKGLQPQDISNDARLEFIPALEEQLATRLPDLAGPDAFDRLQQLCIDKGITLPSNPTLPRLLDHLCSELLEPKCQNPTFIVHHPACMSPLSKHFRCEKTNQMVAARAELYIQGRECANMYEEENSPFEQRRKFEEQLKHRQSNSEPSYTDDIQIDESYLEALEWGMPPTGGWGCGMDRLTMLLSGQERIADVLSFGSLRNVVGLSRGWR